MNRTTAFLTHFGISFVVFVFLAYLVLYVWYPDFFFETDGGWQGMRIIIAVDLVLGPLLTLIVFKRGKPGLKLDLTMIAAVQIVCLAAGVWVVYEERPVALVFVDGYFYSMSAGELNANGHKVPTFQKRGPQWVMVDIPEDPYEQSELRHHARDTGISLRFMSDLYVPFDPNAAFKNWQEPWVAIDEEAEGAAALAQFLSQVEGEEEEFRFVPYGARYAVNHLVFRRDDHSFVGLLETEPG